MLFDSISLILALLSFLSFLAQAQLSGPVGPLTPTTSEASIKTCNVLSYGANGEVYCRPLTASGVYALYFDQLHNRCWEGDAGPTVDPTRVNAIVLYAPAEYPLVMASVWISTCFRDIVPLFGP